MKLKQGDYVINLTKEQFEELLKIQLDKYSTYNTLNRITYDLVFEGNYISAFLDMYERKTELTFEEFKQRAINTFKV